MKEFLGKAEYQENPLRLVYDFMENEKRLEAAEKYSEMRFVGYVMDIGYDSARIITCDPYKRAVGGVPKGPQHKVALRGLWRPCREFRRFQVRFCWASTRLSVRSIAWPRPLMAIRPTTSSG